MEPTSQENDKLPLDAGKTVGGADLVIIPTKSGMYQVECRGSGVAPAICNDLFTDLRLAKRAVEQYRLANAVQIAKKESIDAIVEKKLRRAAEAKELKNGELEVQELED